MSTGMPAGMSLIYAADARPNGADIARIAAGVATAMPRFSISHQPPQGEGWLELLSSGLTFDLSGLAPAAPLPLAEWRHAFGFSGDVPQAPCAVGLVPGPHLSGGKAMMPVVRTMVGLAASLAAGTQAQAIAWHPARSLIEPALFCRIITAWLAGGAFPALGLTALARDPDGGLRSEGLAFFTGQELRIEPDMGKSEDAARLAVRLIDALVTRGPVSAPFAMTMPDGGGLQLAPSANGRYVRAWRGESET